MQDTITPVLVNMLAVGVNVGISLALVGPMGHVGLALGGACQPIASFLILQAVLRYREKKWMRKERPNGLEDRYSLAASIAKSVVSATVMWAAVSFFDAWITTALPGAGCGFADSAAWRLSRRGSSRLFCSGRYFEEPGAFICFQHGEKESRGQAITQVETPVDLLEAHAVHPLGQSAVRHVGDTYVTLV